jgi:tetratricopeptide (TPR) repeat protein
MEIAAAHQAQHLAQQAASDQRLLRAANTRWVRGNIAMARLRYVDAAQHFQEAADLVPADHSDEKGRLLRAKADALQYLGGEHGDNTVLISAIATYWLAMEELTRERVPLEWARTQNNLGNTLGLLGKRERDITRLEDAVTAFHVALEEQTRDLAPMDWGVDAE